MEIKFNVTGSERKQMVQEISRIVGQKPIYKGAPTFSFAVADFIIDRNGTLFYEASTDGALVERLLDGLAKAGFACDAPTELVIELPKAGISEAAIANLEQLVKSKETLIMKALGTESLPIRQTDDTLQFPWFIGSLTSEEINAYARFIGALYAMAKSQKRVTAKEKPTANEKYAFRCFLLRLGFIGQEYKAERKILLSRLSGSSAFKSGSRKTEEVVQ